MNAGSLAEALEHALDQARDGQLEQLDEDVDLQEVLAQAADGRAHTRARAQRQSGRPVTTHPWQITRTVTAPIQQPTWG